MEAKLETVNTFQTDVQMALADFQEALQGYTSGVKMEEANGGKRNVAIKLPKLNLRRFNGDPRNWFPFWDSFEGAIHKRQDLTERDKFDYLKGLLDGEAHDSIANYKMDAKNYRAALRLLAERYGDTERISRIHYDALMNLQPVFSDNDVARLRKFYNELETNHRALLSLGKKQEMYSDILVPQIENKLLQHLRITILQKRKRDNWSMDQLLNVLEDEIHIREGRPLSEKPSRNDFKEDRKKRPPSTANALVGSQMRTPAKLDKRCPYCLGSHAAKSCEKVTSTDDRRKILRKYMRCFSCLNKGHKAKDCRAKRPCTKCQGEHHQSVCQSKEEEVTVSTHCMPR